MLRAFPALTGLCRRHGVRRLLLFGSVLTERFSDSSDIDVLVDFQPGVRVGYLRMASMERELAGLLGGRKVHLRTPNEFSWYFRDEVLGALSAMSSAGAGLPPAAMEWSLEQAFSSLDGRRPLSAAARIPGRHPRPAPGR